MNILVSFIFKFFYHFRIYYTKNNIKDKNVTDTYLTAE